MNRTFTFRTDDQMARRLTALAASIGASESYVLRTLLKAPLENAARRVTSPTDGLKLAELTTEPAKSNAANA